MPPILTRAPTLARTPTLTRTRTPTLTRALTLIRSLTLLKVEEMIVEGDEEMEKKLGIGLNEVRQT